MAINAACIAQFLAAGFGAAFEAQADETTVNPFQARFEAAHAQLKQHQQSALAIGPVLELVSLIDKVPDEAVIGALSPVAASAWRGGHHNPLVAAWAALHLARLQEDRGDRDAAARLRSQLGLIEKFWVLGPFDAQNRAALRTPLAPEAQAIAVAPGASFEGKLQTVKWRRAEDLARSGMLLLDSVLAPTEESAAFMLVYVHSPKSQAAALRVGSGGPVKVWLNGKPVLANEVQRPARLDQDAALLQLEAGENVLVIKTVNLEGPWRLVVRLTDLQGRGLPGVKASLDGKRVAPFVTDATLESRARVAKARSPRVLQLGAELESRWQRAIDAGRQPVAQQTAASLARFWAHAAPYDQQEKPAERVLNATLALADDVTLWRLLGETAAEDNDRRRALEAAAKLAGAAAEQCLLLSALGDLAQTARRPVRSIELRREAVSLEQDGQTSCWPAQLALAEEARISGMTGEALRRLQALPPAIQSLPTVRKRLIRAWQGVSRVDKAQAEAQILFKTRHNDPDVIDVLLQQARAAGDSTALVRLSQELAQQRPDLLFWVQDWAKALEGAGQSEAAAAALAQAAERVPGASDLHEALGRLRARMGQPATAVEALDRSLALRPQNPSLRRYREALARQGGSVGEDRAEDVADLARRYALDMKDAVASTLREPAEKAAQDAARVLLDRRVVRVHDNGLSEVFAQRLVHVLTEPGARQNETFYIRYTPGSQEVEVRQARVYRRKPNGNVDVSAATGRDDRDLSEPWYAMYYDNRAEVVTFEGLRPGDVVEIQYTIADVSARNELAGYFGDFQFTAETAPIDLWQYVLVGPKRKPFYFHTPSFSGFTRKDLERGTHVEYRFQATNVGKVVPEPSAPGWGEIAPFVHVSTYANWEQVGQWYWGLVAEQLTPDLEVRRAAAAAVKGAVSLQDRVRAVHKAVIQGTRYVALEFGIHGYKPYRVSQVLSRRFGDCKDKASLLVAMLAEAGVEAEMVLLRTRRGGRIPERPSSLAVFDHAIAYVPALDLYLDGTAEFSGMNELPYQDQGMLGLRVGPKGSKLVTTPVLPSSANQAKRTWDVTLTGEGRARVNEHVSIVGQAAPEWRQHYQTEGERTERYAKIWNARYPGAVVQKLDLSGTEDPNEAVTVLAEVDVPNLAAVQGDRLLLPVASRPPEYLRSYARLSHRRHDLLLAYPWQHQETLTFHVPPGWRVARTPVAALQETPFGRFAFDVKATADGRSLSVTTHLDMREHRFSPERYGAFRQFLSLVESTLRSRIELERVPE